MHHENHLGAGSLLQVLQLFEGIELKTKIIVIIFLVTKQLLLRA